MAYSVFYSTKLICIKSSVSQSPIWASHIHMNDQVPAKYTPTSNCVCSKGIKRHGNKALLLTHSTDSCIGMFNESGGSILNIHCKFKNKRVMQIIILLLQFSVHFIINNYITIENQTWLYDICLGMTLTIHCWGQNIKPETHI